MLSQIREVQCAERAHRYFSVSGRGVRPLCPLSSPRAPHSRQQTRRARGPASVVFSQTAKNQDAQCPSTRRTMTATVITASVLVAVSVLFGIIACSGEDMAATPPGAGGESSATQYFFIIHPELGNPWNGHMVTVANKIDNRNPSTWRKCYPTTS